MPRDIPEDLIIKACRGVVLRYRLENDLQDRGRSFAVVPCYLGDVLIGSFYLHAFGPQQREHLVRLMPGSHGHGRQRRVEQDVRSLVSAYYGAKRPPNMIQSGH